MAVPYRKDSCTWEPWGVKAQWAAEHMVDLYSRVYIRGESATRVRLWKMIGISVFIEGLL